MVARIEGTNDSGTVPCEDCVKVYGESRNYGGTHWHCSNCLKISSYQGHFGQLADGSWGFDCKKRVE